MKKNFLFVFVFSIAIGGFSENSISILEKIINPATGVIKAKVIYAAEADGYVGIFLGTSGWSWLGDDSIAIEAGSGTIDVSITPATPFVKGVTYNICSDLFSVSPDTTIKVTNDCQEVKIFDPSISIVSKVINGGTGKIDVTVAYNANQDGYVGMYLGASNWSWLGNDSIAIEAGSGSFKVSIAPVTPFEKGLTYNICSDLFSVSPDTTIKVTNDCQEVKLIEPSISIVSKMINGATGDIDVAVSYNANQAGYVGMYLGASNWSWLGDDSIAIEAGSGTFEVSITPVTPFEKGLTYNICSDLFSVSPDTIIKVTNDCQEVKLIEPSISIVSKMINTTTGNIEATVNYATNQDGYVGMFLGTASWSWLGDDSIAIVAGSGTLEVEITPSTPFADGITYNICSDLFGISPDTTIKLTNDCQEVKMEAETGVADVFKTDGIRIYPNPVSDFLSVEVAGKSEVISYKIVTLNGAIVAAGEYLNAGKIDVSGLNQGVYLLGVSMNDGLLKVQEFIKK
ncbi:MAG: T9SS type A sorting domain-containing protein [Prolixibacteraceae bacterium]